MLEVFQEDGYPINEIIEVSRLGGIYEGVEWNVEDGIELEVGSEFILFLYSWVLIGRPYVLISHAQGAYYVPNHIDEDKITALEDDELDVELKRVGEWDLIMITLEDLVDIAEYNDLIESDD